jgi:hypothetical protein
MDKKLTKPEGRCPSATNRTGIHIRAEQERDRMKVGEADSNVVLNDPYFLIFILSLRVS